MSIALVGPRERTVVDGIATETSFGPRGVVFRVMQPYIKSAVFQTLEEAKEAQRAKLQELGLAPVGQSRRGPPVRVQGNLPYISRIHADRESPTWVAAVREKRKTFKDRDEAERWVEEQQRTKRKTIREEEEQVIWNSYLDRGDEPILF